MGPRVLLIKLGALGDVVRTAALIPGIPQITREPSHITWLTAPGAVELVKRMKGVDRVLAFNEESLARLRAEKFDLVICLEKEAGPCAVAMTVNAGQRMGVGLSRYGTPYPLNDHAEYFFSLGLDDEEKFHRNRKSYPQLVYEAMGLEYAGERYELDLTEADLTAASRRFESFNAGAVKTWIGLNPGAGNVFAYKAWREEGYVALVREVAARRPEAAFVLLGGRDEADLLARIKASLADAPVYHAGTDNSLGAFTAIIDRCAVVACGDTLAMHLAIARRRRVVAMFGPTCEQEIDLFGRGVKIKSEIECSPCYLRKCDKNPTCQDLIPESQVVEAVLAQLVEFDREATSSS